MKTILLFSCLILLGSCTVQKSLSSVPDYNKINTGIVDLPAFCLTNSSVIHKESGHTGIIYSRIVYDYDETKKGLNSSDLYTANPGKVIGLLKKNAVNIGANGLIDVHDKYLPTGPPSS